MDQSLYTYLIYFTVLYAIVFQIREVSKRQLNSLTTNEKNYIPTALSRVYIYESIKLYEYHYIVNI